jgi:hypothetical protein
MLGRVPLFGRVRVRVNGALWIGVSEALRPASMTASPLTDFRTWRGHALKGRAVKEKLEDLFRFSAARYLFAHSVVNSFFRLWFLISFGKISKERYLDVVERSHPVSD